MEISEVRVKLVENPSERLQAFCSITLDGDFVIRDLKVIEGANGAFVAMPSRKLADKCPRCKAKNHLRAQYCNECGAKLGENRANKDGQGRAKLHADVAHPINIECRERIQQAVIEAYEAEREASKSPDYEPQPIDEFEDDLEVDAEQDTEAAVSEPQEEEPEELEQPEEPEEEWQPKRSKHKDGSRDHVSDYNMLIADLKKNAADRRGDSKDRSGRSPGEGRRERQSAQPMPAARVTEQEPPPPPKPAAPKSPPKPFVSKPQPVPVVPEPQPVPVVPEPPPVPVVPEPPPTPVVPEPQPVSDEEEDDPFSAGLL